ncbi:hypothetical protein B0H63DRAFT_499825 [Podospora didyma]|uniref:MARVEL domain-containing protein n=1 Tax=Podospora didyma TaxID=330526 RepID=A0AAE0NYM9_9PEZI|nr:hypothetical protein B0H63DRAFT_499825 [Podospora didyma]
MVGSTSPVSILSPSSPQIRQPTTNTIKKMTATHGVPNVGMGADGPFIAHTPIWVLVARGFQVLFTFVVVILAGLLVKGVALDQNVFALVCALFSWIVIAYALITEKVRRARRAYNIWAVIILDAVMALFWLASMGANAALRATYTVKVNCQSDGSGGKTCTDAKRRDLEKRRVVVTDQGLAGMSGIAALSALLTILFIAIIVFEARAFHKFNRSNRTTSADNGTVELKAQEVPMLSVFPGGAAPVQPQYTDQQAYQPQTQQYQAYPQQTTDMPPYQPPTQPQYAGYPQQAPNQQAYPPPMQQQPAYHPQQQSYGPPQPVGGIQEEQKDHSKTKNRLIETARFAVTGW